MRLNRHIPASGVSSDMPSAPWVWIARSSTSMTTFAATTLIIEISWRAARLPAVSIFHAACSVEAGLVGLHPRLGDEVLDELLVGELAAERLALVGAVAHHLDRALGGADRAHAVVDPPGPEPVLGDHEPGAALPSTFASGTRQSS